jgi:two-component system, NarL family, response regulator DevR
MEPIRLLIVDDHPVVRKGIRSVLADEKDIQVVGEAGDAIEALEQAATLKPDIVLLDVRLPGSNGIQIVRQLKRAGSESRAIILTSFEEDEYLFGALQAGAYAYVLKNIADTNLAPTIRAVSRGERLLSPDLLTNVLERFENIAAEKARLDSGLSEYEIEALRLMAKGATNREIAETLFTSEATVKRKIQDLFRKLGVVDRAQAVAEAIGRGLI